MSRSSIPITADTVFDSTNYGLDVFIREGINPEEQISNPLRDDKTPSAKLIQAKSSNLWNLVDYSKNQSWNCIQFIQERYDKSYLEALEYCLAEINPDQIKEKQEYIPREIIYEYTACPFKMEHQEYWNILPEKFLNQYGVYAARCLGINKKIEVIPNNILCFVYEPKDLPYGKLKILKIGVPKEDKWRNNLPLDYLFYTDDIKDGESILLAKSNKDALVNRYIGYKSPAVLSENHVIIIENIEMLQMKFPSSEIILNLGADPQAVKTTKEVQQYFNNKVRSFSVPLKDPRVNDNFEWVKEKGLKAYERLLKKII